MTSASFIPMRRALRSAVASCALLAAAPAAATEIDLISPDTLELTGIFRISATDGERSWLDGGYGKLSTSGSGDGFRLKPQIAEANLVWTPQLGWSVSANIVGTLHGGERVDAGVSEAFLSFRPMRGERVGLSARAGLMWPPVSLEHEGHDWHVADTSTPSAINSWIGEEVRPLALEGTADISAGDHRLRATAAIFAANDTAGTLLAFRGWALHDRKTLASRRQPLPEGGGFTEYQAPFTHPLIDLDGGFVSRPGYYAKLAWQPPLPVRLELFRYDNRIDPEVVNADLEWGWRTQFNHVGAVADLGSGTQLKLQAMSGRTRMGFPEPDRRWVDSHFRSAFVMLTRQAGPIGLAARAEAFATRSRGSRVDEAYDDSGWAATLAAKRDWANYSAVVELMHVSSRIDEREEQGLDPRQGQTRLQADLRLRW